MENLIAAIFVVFAFVLGFFIGRMKRTDQGEITEILGPLKEEISSFRTKVEEVYHSDNRERFSLKEQIELLLKSEQNLKNETQDLIYALKGDNKFQGSFGEMILEKILESSGLRSGKEYFVQGQGMSLKNYSGNSQRPDFIVSLPENKSIVIDSKVSFKHFNDFLKSEDPADSKLFLKSLKSQIDSLANKKYHYNEKLICPEFTLLFIPFEGAFNFALDEGKDLFEYAWSNSVALVGPTSLVPTLKTVSNLWRIERQNKNAQDIAEKSGKLFDKFSAFLEDFLKLGEGLERARKSYDLSFNKLKEGRGNLISRSEELKKLGAQSTKAIPSKFSDAS